MKRLIVMRHAKSDWDSGAKTDHERPLNERGKRDAPTVGKRLASHGFVPQHVISSDSRRTVETLEYMSGYFPGIKAQLSPALYHAGIEAVRDAVRDVPEEVVTLLVLGHNPGWEEMVTELAGKRVEMKTAYAAVLESDETTFQSALAPGKRMRLVELVTP